MTEQSATIADGATVGDAVRTIGWGLTGPCLPPNGCQRPVDLQEVDASVIAPTACTDMTTSMVCVGRTGGGVVCKGDSGGPLLVRVGGTWSVAGVTSRTSGSFCTGPGVFTNAPAFRNWIDSTIGT